MEENAPLGFDFPNLPAGWVWNGYYSRIINSPILGHFDKVAIRVAYDKQNKVHHSCFPAFIIPYLKITTYDLQFIIKSYLLSFCAFEVANQYSQINSNEFFDLPLSSIYSLLVWFIKKCRTFEICFFESNSISVLRGGHDQLLEKFLHFLRSRASP